MITYNNILELIDDLPKYMIPYQYFDICWYIKLKNNKDYEIVTPNGVTRNLKMQYGEYDNPNYIYYEKYNEFENFVKSFENYRFLRNGKIIFSNFSIPDGCIQCNNCGNIWDGNAQCNCYLYNNEFGEYSCDYYFNL